MGRVEGGAAAAEGQRLSPGLALIVEAAARGAAAGGGSRQVVAAAVAAAIRTGAAVAVGESAGGAAVEDDEVATEVAQRVLLVAPALAVGLRGEALEPMARRRRNVAAHCFGFPATEIAAAGGASLNRMQRGPRPRAWAGQASSDTADSLAPVPPFPRLDSVLPAKGEFEGERAAVAVLLDRAVQTVATVEEDTTLDEIVVRYELKLEFLEYKIEGLSTLADVRDMAVQTEALGAEVATVDDLAAVVECDDVQARRVHGDDGHAERQDAGNEAKEALEAAAAVEAAMVEAAICGLAAELGAFCEAHGLSWQTLAALTRGHKTMGVRSHIPGARWLLGLEEALSLQLSSQAKFAVLLMGTFRDVFGVARVHAAISDEAKGKKFTELAMALWAVASDCGCDVGAWADFEADEEVGNIEYRTEDESDG
jgi:hypothetical protein